MSPTQRKAVVAFAWLTAAYCVYGAFFTTYLPLWLKQQGLAVGVISSLMAIQPLTRVFVPYAWGALADKTHKRTQVLRWLSAMTLLCSLGLWWQGGAWWVALVLLGIYAHFSAIQPLSDAAVSQVISQDGHLDSRLYGRIRLCGSVGFMLAVLFAGWWFERQGLQTFVWVVLVSAVLLLLAAMRTPTLYSSSAGQAPMPVASVLRRQEVQWFFVGAFFHVLSHMGLYTFFSLYLDSLGYSKTMIGVYWSVSVTVEIAWFFTQSRWMPLLALPQWLLLGSAVMAVRMAVTAELATVLWVMVIAQAVHAFTFAAHHSAAMALIARFFPGALLGRGQALYVVLAYGVPGMLAGFLGGWMQGYWGLSSIYWACSASAAVAALCAWRIWCIHRSGAFFA
ncbi:MFS transporter [Curvibacter sp. CHRR-16]|uniref:MFS transporter n=1 Tax=Curvibacter sp. CHRR-16 TaxID=2835872 RepID=UPI001BD917FE|nr:MFS transporter [Curvibacter sp. CHRR-16]MBT0569123.1 MFS transporter [Curvibacter sp. CHRR-16]